MSVEVPGATVEAGWVEGVDAVAGLAGVAGEEPVVAALGDVAEVGLVDGVDPVGAEELVAGEAVGPDAAFTPVVAAEDTGAAPETPFD